MAYRNKTYVALDYDNDSKYYNLMKAWRDNDDIDFNFYNAHDLTTIRTWSSEESKRVSLRERMKNSKVLVLLIGENTRYCSTWVKWEIELALKHDLPIIAVNLDGDREYNATLCPSALRGKLAIHIPFSPGIMAYALDHWPARHEALMKEGGAGVRTYKDHVYDGLAVA